MKIIKLFLASSVDEFEWERSELGNYIRQLNDIYMERDIYIRLILCEDFSNAMVRERKQEEYNQSIRESQFFYVLFGKEAGTYTIEEFEVARREFDKRGTPRIYTYFRRLPEGQSPAESVRNFMNRLDQEIGHYYSIFSHLDTVKLNMLLELTRDPALHSRLEFADGEALLDGKPALSLIHIPLYSQNKEVKRLKQELERRDQEFAEAAARLETELEKEKIYRRLSELNAERLELSKQLHTLEMDILGLCRTVSERNAFGKSMTWRERKAGDLVAEGNYEGALNVLRDALRERELEQAGEALEQEQERVREYISENRFRIRTLQAGGINKETLKEITGCYEASVQAAKKYHVEPRALYEYAEFLEGQRRFARGIEIAKTLEYWNTLDGIGENAKAALWDLMGQLYSDTGELKKAEGYYQKALKTWRHLSLEDAEVYEPEVAVTVNNLAILQSDLGQTGRAENYYREALEIWRRLDNESGVSCACNNLALLLVSLGQEAQAENYYREALEIARRLGGDKSRLADTANNLATLLARAGRYEEAEGYFVEALEIERKLTVENLSVYGPDRVGICKNLGDLMLEEMRLDEAKQYYQEALKIRKLLLKTGQ